MVEQKDEQQEYSREQIENFISDRMGEVCCQMGMNVNLKNQKTSYAVLEKLRRTSEFFIFLELSKILIPNPDSITIHSLRKYFDKDEYKIFKEWEDKVKVNVIKKLRNKLVAHYDQKIFDNQSKDIAKNIKLDPIEFKRIEKIVENTINILLKILNDKKR